MKILTVADCESSLLWNHYQKDYLQDIDLILSAGDLDAEYLSFLATMSHAPVLYVPGNHDDKYVQKPPEGCICIDRMLYNYKGIRILGLGGSMRYKEGINQYTENEMQRRVMAMTLKLRLSHGFDILLTHAPARGFHDGCDLPHQGFEAFNRLIRNYAPAYHIHGHMHQSYGPNFIREDFNFQTRVINAYEKHVIEYHK